ncbi:hypothetical protein [Halorussus sp. MSC15.2]|uniref:hypothetical protein n=1 Tax=Halorussus sp. MSC15.2 TaxID=2283638 RepID=UPI0013D5BD59|nr:hypothetical protein [Halorussus sp. MSC15.2]NEU57460.1 hypothetical protein [Halorussus sp. MSC15.2]
MSERNSSIDGIERRGVLAALATGIGGAGVAQRTLARRVDALDATRYVVEQGDRCIPITPLSGDETVESFYDYRTPYTSPSGAAYSSYGTTDLQRPETSICFLYDGPEGLSLVVVHDKLNDGTSGGAVTFDLAFENPDRGSWVVGDDDYDAPSNYDTFDRTADGWSVDWTWTDGRSDGGAYRPLGEEFAVTIDPAFNDAAALYGDPYEGEITDWQVLSGDRSDPDRVSLALDEPLVVRAGTCGATTTTTTRRETTTEETTTEQDDRQSGPISADVTVVPGKVNPRSHGRLPVVVRSTDEFDATALAPGSVAFGPEDGTERASPVKRIQTDADGDGRTDLKFHFRTDATGIDWDTDRVRLTGVTESGRAVEGSAEVRIVPNGDEESERKRDEESEGDGSSEREAEKEEGEGDEHAKKGETEAEDEGNEAEAEKEDGDESEEDDGGDDEGERGGEDGRGSGRGKENGRGRGKTGKGNGKGRERGRGDGRGGDEDD